MKETEKIPFDYQVWSIKEIAEFLKKSEAHIRDRVVCNPDFPVAYRLPSKKGSGHRLWKATEVIEWLEKHREGMH